jgi:hypothetical protein
MAFQTGSSTSIENLMVQLSAFLTANGWTQDFFTTGDGGVIAFSKNGVFVCFKWAETTDGGTLAVYQNTSNDNSASLWLATGDSGGGTASNTLTQLDAGRCVSRFEGPHSGYWFFENDSNPAYCHVVVEVDAGRFRHFGFGELDKIGAWTGGEYCYGHFWSQSISVIDAPASASHDFGMDVYNVTSVLYGATMRIDGYPGEPDAATVWGRCASGNGNGAGNDRAGNPRYQCAGGFRYTREFQHLHAFELSLLNAFKPMATLPMEVLNFVGAPDQVRRVGYQDDVRMVNIANLDPGQIINIAGARRAGTAASLTSEWTLNRARI